MEIENYVETKDFINTYDKVSHFINRDEIKFYNKLDQLYNFSIIDKIVDVTIDSSEKTLFLQSLHEVLLTRKTMLSAI